MKQETVVIPVTGAFNPYIPLPRLSRRGIDWTVSNPFGKSSYSRFQGSLERANIICEDPIVLRSLGIQDPELTHEQVATQVKRRMERHEGALFLLFGHSLGGVILSGVIRNESFDHEVVGAIASGSPFEGANDSFFAPFRVGATVSGQGKRVRQFDEKLGQYIEEILATSQDSATPLHLFCSPDDNAVPIASASCPKINPASVHVFQPRDRKTQLLHAEHHPTPDAVTHIGLLTNKSVAKSATAICVDLLDLISDAQKKHAA